MAPPQIQLLCADVLQPSTLILTGRAEDGRSVSVEVSDAFPYFWLLLPPTWLTDPDKNARRHPLRWALEALWKDLDVEVRRRAANEVNDGRAKRGNAERIDAEHWEKEMLRISFCGDVKEFHRFHGYDADPRKFARVSFASVSALRHARDALMAPKRWLKSMKDKRDMLPASFELAEAQVDFTVQACADAGLIPGGWFTLRPTVRPCKSRARTNLSYRVELFDILPLDRAGLAPIRVLAFDIEVITKDLGNGATRFYDGDNEEGKCLCIAACSMVAGVPGMDRLVFAIDPDSLAERVQTVDATSGEGSVTIHWLPDEKSVLLAFIAHTNRCDPDFVTGWNTDRFDWGWLALAAQRLGIDSFWDFSRFANYPKAYYNVRLYTDKVLARQLKKKVILQTPGRVPYDLFTWFKRNYQLASYKLDFVAHTYGCGAKDDMPYHLIGEAFKTQEGRLKLALYCEQDTALVLKLIQNPKLDPIGKDLALCSITGVWPTDLLGRGTQNTLLCKLVRVSHARGFVLPYVPGADMDAEVDEGEQESQDSDDEEVEKAVEDTGYQGGKVLTAQPGRYTSPVAVFDFASLYPSCMEQHNICKSSEITRARALQLGVPVTTPPAPSLTGVWRTPSGDVAVDDNFRTGLIKLQGEGFHYETDLNLAIVCGSRRAELFDSGYGLRWSTNEEWTRAPEDILCFTDREFFTGLVPELEKTLKIDRKAAKKKMAEAEEAGNKAVAAYLNNVQNSIKVLMNGMYGGFGCSKGGIFPNGFKLAAAITATGRGWICTVKRIIESSMWVGSGQRFGIGEKPEDCSYVRVVYGDTDSVFCHLDSLCLHAAGAFGDQISDYFSKQVLPYPQKLEFEKVYYPFVLYRKKMYSGAKYEGDYGLPCGPPPEPKLHSRGIALVRRDNAPAVRKILKTALEMMMRSDMNASEVVQAVAAYVHLLRASARSIHSTDRPAEHLAMDQFVVSGGLSKDVEDYDGPPNAAVHVACRLMELMPLEKLGAGTRVMYVVRALHKDAKRGEQACLVDDLVHNRFPLDISYYEGAVRSKLDPILSALFVVEERARRTHVGIDGRVMVVEHARASDRAALPGQVEAARRLSSAIAEHRRAAQVETVAVAPVFARMAASVAIPKALPPKKEKRKEGPQIDAFAMMKAASKVVKR